VGCCCDQLSGFDAALNLDCSALHLDAATWCEQDGRYSVWELQIGDQTIPFDGFEIDCEQITNYSTYTGGPVRLTHRVFCDSQEVVVTQELLPPVDGIFIGGSLGCDGGGCIGPVTNLSDYEAVLPGVALDGSIVGLYDVYVSGIINVDKSFTFINGIDLFMGTASGFDIPAGRTLEFANSVTATGFCCLWRGIFVKSGGIFRSQCGGSPTLTNRIEDALYAVRAFHTGGAQPRVAVRETVFHNNLIGIRGTDGAFVLGSNQTAYFARNTFSSDDQMLCIGCLDQFDDILPQLGLGYTTERGLAGIWLEGGTAPTSLTNVNIMATPDDAVNVFDNLALGIYARNINLNINDCAAFRNITLASPYAMGYGVDYADGTGAFGLNFRGLVNAGTNVWNADAFDKCTVGIRAAGNALTPTTINIRDSRMVNMQTGIQLEGILGNLNGETRHNNIRASIQSIAYYDELAAGAHTYRITDNTLNTGVWGTGIGLYGNPLATAAFVEIDNNVLSPAGNLGIHADNHPNAYIHNNDLTVNSAFYGIYAQNGQYEIECNNIAGTASAGIFAWNSPIRNDLSFNTIDGPANGLVLELDCPGENDVNCNTFNNTAAEGMLYNDAFTGPQYNTGNTWTNTAGATFIPGMYQANFSQYDVPDLTPWKPVPVNPAINWFVPDAFLPPPACQLNCQQGILPPGGGAGSGFDVGIATGAFAGEGYDNWRRGRYLLYKTAAYPEVAPAGSAQAGFQTAQAETALGRLTQIGLQTIALFETPPAEAALLTANALEIETASAAMLALDEQLNDNLAQETYDGLLAQRDSLNTAIAALLAQRQTTLDALQTARNATADHLLASLQIIATQASYEENEKNVLDIYLKTIARAQAPNAAQLAALRAIGEQCPREGGPAAVLLAANLYEGFTGDAISEPECGTNERNQPAPASTAAPAPGLRVSAYPNPARGLLRVEARQGRAPYVAQLLDAYGREQLRQELPDGQAHNLGLAGLPAGLYRLVVTDAEGARSSAAVVVE
jgi:hypothetical protein